MSVIIVIWLVAINNRHNGFVVCRCLFIIHDAGIFIVGSFRLKHRACAIFTGVDSQHGSQRHRNLTRMTVEENLAMGGFFAERDQFQERIKWVYELFPRLHERRVQRAGTMSGGEQQMLAIGRALMSNPRLLLLDEPSLGLAPIIIQQIFDTIEQLREQGMTIFLVEQNANQALKLADRGYVLENGHVVLSDTGDALLANEAVRSAYLGG